VRLSRVEISETEYSGRLLRNAVGAEVSVIGPMMLCDDGRSPELHHGSTEKKEKKTFEPPIFSVSPW
jgi:hypothetical protein